eukprot:CCRYP_015473-RA/>CCRYP_015473-RA protein AED:0.16 eAED:0.29 QI:0/0.37/0.22/1/1/1/9/0/1809
MDFSDDFDDIFLDSGPPFSSADPKKSDKESSKNECETMKKNGQDFHDADSSSSNDAGDSSSSSFNDDSSVEFIKPTFADENTTYRNNNDAATRGSNKGGKHFLRKCSTKRSEDRSDDNKSKSSTPSAGDDRADCSDDDLDDDALIEFFSNPKAPKITSKPKGMETNKKELCMNQTDVFDLDDEALADLEEDESFDESKPQQKPVLQASKLVLDDDPAEFEQDEAEVCTGTLFGHYITEKTPQLDNESSTCASNGESPVEPKEDHAFSEKTGNTTTFRITYNGEKRECQVDDALVNTSDDESNATGVLAKPRDGVIMDEMTNDSDEFRHQDHSTSSSSRNSSLCVDRHQPRDEKENGTSNILGGMPSKIQMNPYKKTKTTVSMAKSSSRSTTASHSTTSLTNVECGRTFNRSELDRLGIDHVYYKPPKYIRRADPILHRMNESNRPIQHRRKIAVGQIFSPPFSNLFMCKFKEFNHLQSEMSNVIANSDDNVIVSSPTGSGKTALFEMAMCRIFASNLTENRGGKRFVSNSKKVVYIAPNKALCEERQNDWSKRLVAIDPTIACVTITGDSSASASSYSEIASAHLILTTPEKWDSITRRWTEYVVLLGSIKLVVLDEVHMIGEPERGACLESIICRMKTIQRASTARELSGSEIESSSFKDTTTPKAITCNMRFVAVSATLPNLVQLASFIEAGEAYAFDDSYRPVPLLTYVQACGHIGKNRYLFDKSLNQYVPNILRRFSKGRPAIVFCHSKKETEQLADELTKSYSNPSALNCSTLNSFASQASSSSLQRFIRCGIGYHHAGLAANDRKIVEESFMSGSINCLCATSTLAMGVNLPSHLVVIKGNIDTGTLLQMIGRAGRPGFDSSGVAVIMTDSASKLRFENLSHGLKVVESHLMDEDRLTEALNNEISQGVITSQTEAVDWVSGTLLFRRIQAHPLFYGLSGISGNGHDDVMSFIAEKCKESIDHLCKMGAIVVKENGTFSPSATSIIMSRNFIDLQTMRSITKLRHDCGPHQLLHLLSNCEKLQSPVRRHEKKHLNEAYKQIKYKLEGPQSKIRIQTPAEKAFVLLQSIGQHDFEDFALRQEMNTVLDGAVRILTAIEDHAREGSRHGHVLAQSLLLRRAMYHGLWGENDGVLKQIGGVTRDLASELKANCISTFDDVIHTSSDDISKACNMPLNFGNSLKAAAAMILQCTLKLSCFTEERGGGLDLVIKIQRKEFVDVAHPINSKDNVKYSLLVFSDRPEGLLLSCDNISDESQVAVKCPEKFGRVYIRLISNLVGLDEQLSVDGNDRVEKSLFSLSPVVAKSATKSKTSQICSKPSESAGKRAFESHRSSVSNVGDMRLHKRGKVVLAQSRTDCIEIDSGVEEDHGSSKAYFKTPSAKKKAVTPSPHPAPKPSIQNDLTPTFGRGTIPKQMDSASERTHKRVHKVVQRKGFISPNENPYHSYVFDPNNIENSLESAATGSNQTKEVSILPSDFSTKRSRGILRTPATRRKSCAAPSRISNVGLLRQKATELQHHRQQVTPQFTDRTNRHLSGALSRQIGNYGGRFDNEPMQGTLESDMTCNPRDQFMAPTGCTMHEQFGILKKPDVTQAFDYDVPLTRAQLFTKDDCYAPFTHPYDRHISRPDYSNHSFGSKPSVRSNGGGSLAQASTMYDRPTSSAGYSDGSGLQRFRQGMHQHQFRRGHDSHFSLPQENDILHPAPQMQKQPYHNFCMPFQTKQRSQEIDFSVYKDVAENSRTNEFDNPFLVQFNGTHNPIRTSSVQNSYSRSQPAHTPMRTDPPKEIVLQNPHLQATDDASLAFDDAFL